jgi:xyloglucan-specific exo-beta-1,4-glucanase
MATVGAEFTNVHGAIKVAMGAPAPGSSYPAAVYLIGTIDGKEGADASVYGRVILSGRGMVYNE